MLAAAGSGQRLGAGGPKAFVELGGRPLIEWSLLALARAECIESIVVAAPPGGEDEAERAVERACGGTPARVVAGGATRAESVAAALEASEGELVAIHDAARPLVTSDLVDRIVTRLASSAAGGVIAAAPLADTVKRADAPRRRGGEEADGATVAETLDRDLLWAAQTPQAFRVEALREAQARAADAGELELATDEAWLIERAGGTVLLEPSGASNLKITTPDDLVTAAALLGAAR